MGGESLIPLAKGQGAHENGRDAVQSRPGNLNPRRESRGAYAARSCRLWRRQRLLERRKEWRRSYVSPLAHSLPRLGQGKDAQRQRSPIVVLIDGVYGDWLPETGDVVKTLRGVRIGEL